jgi:hypothetical protein
VNADYLAALGTGPFFLFIPDEIPYAKVTDIFKIVDHAHAVFRSISLIQLFQPGAGEAFASEAVPAPGVHLFTVLDSTQDAGFRFAAVVAPATGTCLFISYVSPAEAAIHSAGSDQRHRN